MARSFGPRAFQHQPDRQGFTLVELLVVIGIIGILMGLLIPAVNAAREAARRNQCTSQINNLAKGAIQEEMAKREYPGWIKSYGMFTGTVDPSEGNPAGKSYAPHAKVGGWVISLLPYLEAQPTFEIWTQDKYPVIVSDAGTPQYTKSSAPNLPIMRCPSSITLESASGKNSYVANTGMSHDGAPVSFERTMSRSNGVFNSKVFISPLVPLGPAVRADDLKDGLGNTVLFSENLQAQPWHQILPGSEAPSIGALQSGITDAVVGLSRYAQGFVWHYRDDQSVRNSTPPAEVMKINGTDGTDIFGLLMNNANAQFLARPSSAHNSGVNMGFADGSSRFVSDSIDYRVYCALMTPRGKSSDVPFNEFVLDSSSF